MAGIEMKLRLVHPLVAGAGLLVATAGYVELSRTIAQPADGAASGVTDAGSATSPPASAAASPPPSGNPLWTIPLKQLALTRERPIFSPSRRPPPPAVVAPVYAAPVARPQKPKEPERPQVSLVGTVAGGSEGIGVFLEMATRNIVRLRVGEDHEGWVLRSIKGRAVTLEKNSETALLELPPPGSGDAAVMANSAPVGADPAPRRQPRR
jgi:hypothetical protein